MLHKLVPSGAAVLSVPSQGIGVTVKSFLIWLTGGRPMKRTGYAFTDKVSGNSVNSFTDQLGRDWLAEHAWSLFRVER